MKGKSIVYRSKLEDDWNVAQKLLEEAGLASPFAPGALADMAGKVEKLLESIRPE